MASDLEFVTIRHIRTETDTHFPDERKLIEYYKAVLGFVEVELRKTDRYGNPLPENQRAVYGKA